MATKWEQSKQAAEMQARAAEVYSSALSRLLAAYIARGSTVADDNYRHAVTLAKAIMASVCEFLDEEAEREG